MIRLLVGSMMAMAMGAPALAEDEPDVVFGPRQAVPQLPCQADDRPETDLQGRVPREDIASGRAAQGYTCNLEVVGNFPGSAWANHDSFEDCAYFGRQSTVGGVQVMNVSDPERPVPTDTLLTPAMQDPGESLQVNVKRKLLAANGYQNGAATPQSRFLDIYDISDCRHPKLLSTTDMSPAMGHSGWFSPDGATYYMSANPLAGNPSVFPVDISDPTKPRLLGLWSFEGSTHNGFTTEDGTRSYICRQAGPPDDALLIVDTSDVAARRPDPQGRLLAQIPLGDNQWCQGFYRVTYKGHPYLIQYGEISGASDCSRSADNWANFAYPRIFDLADERHPVLVSTALLQVHLPVHCAEVQGEGAPAGFGYSVHHCSPDRLYDPTILACAWFHGGMRVLDIRDPHHPVEIGYVNPGTSAALGTNARPVVRAERGEIWFTHENGGFYVVRFKNGIWPFKTSAACPEFDDYFFVQYNPGSRCATANLNGIGKPAPIAPVLQPSPQPALRRPTVALRVSPRRDRRAPFRFRVSGALILPDGFIAGPDACVGRVTVTMKSRRRTLVGRTAPLDRNCRFRTAVTLRTAKGRKATLSVGFGGNRRLGRATSRRLVVRVR